MSAHLVQINTKNQNKEIKHQKRIKINKKKNKQQIKNIETKTSSVLKHIKLHP